MSENEEAGGHVGSENGPKPPQRSAKDQGSVLAERFDNMAHSLDRLVTTLQKPRAKRARSLSASRSPPSPLPGSSRQDRKGKSIDRSAKRLR